MAFKYHPEHEDVEVMVAYALNLLDARQNITIDGKRVTENSNVRVIEHADNVMALSYMANQVYHRGSVFYRHNHTHLQVYIAGGDASSRCLVLYRLPSYRKQRPSVKR